MSGICVALSVAWGGIWSAGLGQLASRFPLLAGGTGEEWPGWSQPLLRPGVVFLPRVAVGWVDEVAVHRDVRVPGGRALETLRRVLPDSVFAAAGRQVSRGRGANPMRRPPSASIECLFDILM